MIHHLLVLWKSYIVCQLIVPNHGMSAISGTKPLTRGRILRSHGDRQIAVIGGDDNRCFPMRALDRSASASDATEHQSPLWEDPPVAFDEHGHRAVDRFGEIVVGEPAAAARRGEGGNRQVSGIV